MSRDIMRPDFDDETAIEEGRIMPIGHLGVSYNGIKINRITSCLFRELRLEPKDPDGGIDQALVVLAVNAIASKLYKARHVHQCVYMGKVVWCMMNEHEQWTLMLGDYYVE